MSASKLLVAGLGGGLDVVNAALLFLCAKHEKKQVNLGSARPAPLAAVQGGKPFSICGSVINSASLYENSHSNIRRSKINRPRTSRYAEPLVSKYLNNENIYYIARTIQDDSGKTVYLKEKLRETIDDCYDKCGFSDLIFVDGGGDSLIVRSADSPTGTDPFEGGDAQMLMALHGRPRVIQAIISVGLDIKEDAFEANLQQLKQRGGYFGRVNVLTGVKEDYQLDHLFSFSTYGKDAPWMKEYFALCERVLVLKEEDHNDLGKMMSHTGVVTYHALKGHFGVQRTFVQWEPVQPDGSKGVLVKEEHCWIYFVNPSVLEELKIESNPKPQL